MAWVMLGVAGIFEVVWATFMKLSEGFTKLGWTLLTFAGMAVSFALLARATKTLPLGTAYAVWTGIGALGSVIVGIVFFKEPVTVARIFFAALLLAGIVGLKLTAASGACFSWQMLHCRAIINCFLSETEERRFAALEIWKNSSILKPAASQIRTALPVRSR